MPYSISHVEGMETEEPTLDSLPELCTVSDVARYFRCSKRHIQRESTSLVCLIGDGGERSNSEAAMTRVKDLLWTRCRDWRCVDFGSLVRLVERDLRVAA